MSSFMEDFAKVRIYRKADRITAEINKIGVERKELKDKALKLVNKREALLGQPLTVSRHS